MKRISAAGNLLASDFVESEHPMTGASKILTVSYGTFSCTLEGFDDPFNTMKAIAEYFRDLAAEDRYFGAEPPTPDAAMLHRIAEREIQRRVEAKVQENGIILRAAEGEGSPAVAAPLAEPAAPAPAAPRLMEQPPQAAETVVEKLSRLRAEAGGQPAATTAPVLTVAQPAPDAAYSVPEFVAPDFGEDEDYDLPPRDDTDFAEADYTAAPDDLPEDAPDLTADLPEELPAQVADVTPAAPLADPSATDALLAGLMADLSAESAPKVPAAAAIAPDQAADDIALPQSLFVETADEAEEPEAPEAEEISLYGDDADEDDPVAPTEPEIAPLSGETAEAAAEPLYAVAEAAEAPDLTAPDVSPEAVAEAAPALRPDASEKLQRARARVVRIRRADPSEVAPATLPPEAVTAEPAATILSPEAEAALAAELAALSAETEAEAPHQDAAPPSDADQRRAFDDTSADATISRLMAQADEHLEGPESKRRLSAIAHLKAAVAATVAERRVTGDKPKDAEPSQLSRYRDDLAKVVRNTLGGNATPQAERPAPLVLVSEQRIDRPRPVAVPSQPAPAAVAQPVGTVMPRRVSGSASLAYAQDDEDLDEPAEAIGDSRGFVEFAGRLGATSLAELIEASAAYLACVEGREHFTRPQLMGLVQAAMPDGEVPREDGLRSFGTLLRSGRIAKVRRGQFALSEGSAYLTEGRRIAG